MKEFIEVIERADGRYNVKWIDGDRVDEEGYDCDLWMGVEKGDLMSLGEPSLEKFQTYVEMCMLRNEALEEELDGKIP